MWLGLFSAPSARSRLAETVTAAKSSALDELYGRVFACAALERLLKAKLCGAQNPNIFADRAKPSNASMRSPYTKGLAVCQIQGPYEEAESYSVIRRARHYCKQTWPSGNHQCQRFSHVHIRPSRANEPSLVKNYDAAVEITALQPQQAAAISRPQDYKKQ